MGPGQTEAPNRQWNMANGIEIDADTLQEYFDGRLRPDHAAVVAAHLLENPELGREFEKLGLMDDALGGMNSDVLSEPVPERLSSIVRNAARPAAAAATPGVPAAYARGQDVHMDSVSPPFGRTPQFGNGVMALVIVTVACTVGILAGGILIGLALG